MIIWLFCIINPFIEYFTFMAVLGGSNFADAFLEVEEEQDYPPTANAGEDIIIHLPKNEVTLHGNGSSDDHGMYDSNFTITDDFVRI